MGKSTNSLTHIKSHGNKTNIKIYVMTLQDKHTDRWNDTARQMRRSGYTSRSIKKSGLIADAIWKVNCLLIGNNLQKYRYIMFLLVKWMINNVIEVPTQ